jgi:hypothetical protein
LERTIAGVLLLLLLLCKVLLFCDQHQPSVAGAGVCLGQMLMNSMQLQQLFSRIAASCVACQGMLDVLCLQAVLWELHVGNAITSPNCCCCCCY